MRVGIDIRALDTASGRRGVGIYIRGLLAGLAQEIAGSEDDLVVFENGTQRDLGLAGVTRVELSRPRRGITFWDQLAWPPLLARRGVTVFHSPFYAIPRLRPPGCRVVQTVHDLTPLKLPGTVSRRNARLFRINFNLARSADRIIVPSQATRADVISLLAYPEDSITVIAEATDITSEEIAAAENALPAARARLGLGTRYLLHTGGHDIVKNVPGLLDALALLVARGHEIDLVIAGEHSPATNQIIGRAAMHGVLDRVRLPGYLPRRDLIALYVGAAAVVYPSYAEGFGLPVIEAMACGAPVVTSKAGALPEVGGDACLYVEPADPEALADAISHLLEDAGLAADLSRRGRERAGRYSWRETARRTLALYREMAA